MKRLLAGLVIGSLAGAAFAQPPTGPLSVEDRVYPRPQSGSPAPPHQGAGSGGQAVPQDGLMLLMQQMSQMEDEIQRLQGRVEELQHELESGRRAERERYLDLDTRINALAEASIEQGERQTAQARGGTRDSASAEDDRAAYAAAREKLLGRQFEEAGKAFEGYLSDYPKGQFRPFAHFWLGEIYRSRSTPDRDKAMQQFRIVVDEYPDHSQVPAALYKLATLQAETGDTNRARVTLNRIIRQYEDSSEARLARSMLEQLGDNS
ncbi:tol-pal system protein YbgF [Isoalcanivorax indicus]|uniref:tol-pal system protein YbgF n=1 Tax=Isoalcanivorax indicus TaxID=2202653 RepID=UPI000DBA9824|nr:tol-pal system protein YbgF [Isoalcanivorax indicus]